jgi:hypothetical protein
MFLLKKLSDTESASARCPESDWIRIADPQIGTGTVPAYKQSGGLLNKKRLFSEHDEHFLDFYEYFQALGEAFSFPALENIKFLHFSFLYVSFAFQVRDTQHSLMLSDSKDNLIKSVCRIFCTRLMKEPKL